MTQLKQLLFFISLLLTVSVVQAQQEEVLDTIKATEVFGIRAGVDISKPIIGLIDENFKGIEFVTDVRVYKNIYAALEFGYDDNTIIEDYLDYNVKGSYFKLGANYNAYKNWAGMTNEIYVGFRYGLSFFDQTLNSYTPNMYGTYFEGDLKEPNITLENDQVQWAEFVMGIKAETLKNLYLGFSLSFKVSTSKTNPDNFKTLYAPGFYKISLNDMGFGFNYTVSYLIPYSKKSK